MTTPNRILNGNFFVSLLTLLVLGFALYKVGFFTKENKDISPKKVEAFINVDTPVLQETFESDISSIVDKITENPDAELKKFKIEAVGRGKARWITDKNGDVEFEWLPNHTNIVIDCEKAYKEDREHILTTLNSLNRFYILLSSGSFDSRFKPEPAKIEPVKSEPVKANVVSETRQEVKPIRFGPQELQTAQKYNYNIEEFLKSKIHLKVSSLFKSWDGQGKDEFEVKVSQTIDTCIKEAFDGFETYNKIYK